MTDEEVAREYDVVWRGDMDGPQASDIVERPDLVERYKRFILATRPETLEGRLARRWLQKRGFL